MRLAIDTWRLTIPGSQDELPTGSNSFFRQLDYIIA